MEPDTATSDIVAVMALIAVFVTAAAIAGVTLLSYPPGDAAPAMIARMETEGGNVSIYHDGGDPLELRHFAILIDGFDRTENFSLVEASGIEYEPGTWTTWRTGQALVLVPNADVTISEDPHIQIVGEGMSHTGSDWLLHEIGNGTPTTPTPTETTPTPTETTPTPVSLVANFTANITAGLAPLSVQFTDTSTGGPTSWSWNFGDGATSAEQSPVHIYASPSIYTVSLTATNAAGSDTETKMGYITVATAPTVTAISPDSMNRGNTVWPTITGTGFMSGATVKLTKAGESDIIATNIVVNSPTSINCKIELPLQGKHKGSWNVVVTNSDGQFGTLVDGFEVTNK